MTIIDVAGDNMIIADVHLQCRLRDQLDRRATSRSRCEFHPVLGMEVSNQVLISRPGMPRTPD